MMKKNSILIFLKIYIYLFFINIFIKNIIFSDPGQRIMEAGGSWRLVAPDAAVQNTLHIKNVYDFDLHEEYPNGQNILHFATYTQDSCELIENKVNMIITSNNEYYFSSFFIYIYNLREPSIVFRLIDAALIGSFTVNPFLFSN